MDNLLPPVPKAISSHPLYPHLLLAIRIIRFLTVLLTLVLVTIYTSRLLTTIIRAEIAVQGNVAAALAYTLIATFSAFLMIVGDFAMKVFQIGVDLWFIATFTAVAVLKSRAGGAARGRCPAYCGSNDKRDDIDGNFGGWGLNCVLVTAMFAWALVSIISHAASAWMHHSRQSVSRNNDPRTNDGLFARPT